MRSRERKNQDGAASVLIGLTFFGLSGQNIKADVAAPSQKVANVQAKTDTEKNSQVQTTAAAINKENISSTQAAKSSQISKNLNPKELTASKAAPAQDKIDWDAVEYSKDKTSGNVEITGYDGDDWNIVLPNAYDFQQKGVIDKNHAAEISSAAMGEICEYCHHLTISHNGNGKLIAKDSDWSGVFGNGANILNTADLNNLDTSRITNMHSMFSGANALQELDISDWDTSQVTDMGDMFSGTVSLPNVDLSKWNTAKVTNMNGMFAGDTALQKLDANSWDTSNVTDMSSMFYNDTSLTTVNAANWNTGNVTNMSNMFNNDTNLKTVDPSKWNTGKVTDMNKMFSSDDNLGKLDLHNWNTGAVTNMKQMFAYDPKLTDLNVTNWNTGKVTDMSYMFSDDNGLKKLDLTNWDNSKADLSGMFYGTNNLEVTANTGKFADNLAKKNYGGSEIDQYPKAVITNDQNLLKKLTNNKATPITTTAKRTIILSLANVSLTQQQKQALQNAGFLQQNNGNWQLVQSINFVKPVYVGKDGKLHPDEAAAIADANSAKNVSNGQYKAVAVPQIAGYTNSPAQVEAAAVSDNDNIQIYVSYSRNYIPSGTGNTGSTTGNNGNKGSANTNKPGQNTKPKPITTNEFKNLVLVHNASLYRLNGSVIRNKGRRIVWKRGRYLKAWHNGKIVRINHERFYQVGKNAYVKVANAKAANWVIIKLTHNARIFTAKGRAIKARRHYIVLKRGRSLKALRNGKQTKIKGKRFYQIGKNRFVKVVNTLKHRK